MSVKLNELLKSKIASGKKLLSVFITAGYPRLPDTREIILALDEAGVDFIELGIPFSDPIADGPVIQKASDAAIQNGVNLPWIFDLVKNIRRSSQIPLILMGYLNPANKMGLEAFITRSAECGADGFIIPDWPLEESSDYENLLIKNDLDLIHLIAPNTKNGRISRIDEISRSFIYCVAYTGVTGQSAGEQDPARFISRLRTQTSHPLIVGFGVKSRQDYEMYTQTADGVIIGSAFIEMLSGCEPGSIRQEVLAYIKSIRD